MKSFVAAVGCSSDASVEEIVALVDGCCAEAGIAREHLVALASHVRKSGSLELRLAALRLDLPLRFLDEGDVAGFAVCEPVATAAGSLRLGKRKSRFATCAIGACASGFRLEQFGQPAASAAMASSTEATSWAGP